MFIDLDGYMAEVQITEWEPSDPDHVVWRFADDGLHALAEKLDLYCGSELIALFDRAAEERKRASDEDAAADAFECMQEAV